MSSGLGITGKGSTPLMPACWGVCRPPHSPFANLCIAVEKQTIRYVVGRDANLVGRFLGEVVDLTEIKHTAQGWV